MKWPRKANNFRKVDLIATFNCIVEGRTAVLDYESYHRQNEMAEVDIGQMRLTFTSKSRTKIANVEWRDNSSENYKAANVEVRKGRNFELQVPWNLKPGDNSFTKCTGEGSKVA